MATATSQVRKEIMIVNILEFFNSLFLSFVISTAEIIGVHPYEFLVMILFAATVLIGSAIFDIVWLAFHLMIDVCSWLKESQKK